MFKEWGVRVRIISIFSRYMPADEKQNPSMHWYHGISVGGSNENNLYNIQKKKNYKYKTSM